MGREFRKGCATREPGQQHIASNAISPVTWPASRRRSTIGPRDIHVWAWALAPAVDLSADIALLDPQELERLHKFHFAPDRNRYAVAHANMRRILSAYLHCSAEKISFHVNRFGKPALDGPLHFNLSHSRSIAVLAVAHGQPVGVDVEDVRPIEPEVADTHFSAAELSQLNGLQGDAWLTGFYRCWTRKEAILKAEGVGLNVRLDSFDVELLPDKPAQLLGIRHRFTHPWKLYDVSPTSATMGALATAEPQAEVACFHLIPD